MTAIDNATASLILQLLSDDGQTATTELIGKGKQAVGVETDAQMAMRLFLEEEVQGLQTFVADRVMAQSIQTAVCLDEEICAMAERQDRMVAHDRNLSLALSQRPDDTFDRVQADLTTSDNDDYERLIDKMAYLYVTGGREDVTDDVGFLWDQSEDDDHSIFGCQPESSAWAASRERTKAQSSIARLRRGDQKPSHMCNSCMEMKNFAQVATLPCKHEYCRDCLQQLFRSAMQDEAYFPARCCKREIRIDHQVRLFLTGELVRQFEQKAVEYSTPRRTYCHEPTCAAFIPPSNYINSLATCASCARITCITCKQASHVGDCPNDEALQSVIEIARQQGWQRCQQCWSMVILAYGCNHMSCRCGFEFCYVCGGQWKTCRCEQWDEHHLLQRAVQIDARDRPLPNPTGNQHRLVERAAAHNGPRQSRVAGAATETGNAREEHPAGRMGVEGIARQARILDTQELRIEPQVVQPEPQVEAAIALPAPPRRIAEIMENLRNNHECGHQRWRSRTGPRRCEECADVMPMFIYECRQCHIMACRRCRYHRL